MLRFRFRFRSLARVAAVAVVVFAAPAAEAASKIGVAAAIQNEVNGSVGGRLAAGSGVFQNERVTTGASAMAQLLFLDETTLSLGPDSDVTLDRFVFDPQRGTGDVVLSATRGAFRFITGSQDPKHYKLNTAIASIGVRGTIVDSYLTALGLTVMAQEGTVVVDVGGATYTLHPGQVLFVDADGTVHGPMVPDGHFFDVVGITPFELYGAYLPGDHQHVVVPDDSTLRVDELFPHPPPDEEGGDCCFIGD